VNIKNEKTMIEGIMIFIATMIVFIGNEINKRLKEINETLKHKKT
jgi:hypothetical protein